MMTIAVRQYEDVNLEKWSVGHQHRIISFEVMGHCENYKKEGCWCNAHEGTISYYSLNLNLRRIPNCFLIASMNRLVTFGSEDAVCRWQWV